MKKQPKLSIIKPVLGTTGVSDTDFAARLNAIHDGMLNNPAYPSPPVDPAAFKTGIDGYSAAITAALDGGKAAMTALAKHRADVTVMYRLLGHYVESACNGDMNTFVSSGFVAQTKSPRAPEQAGGRAGGVRGSGEWYGAVGGDPESGPKGSDVQHPLRAGTRCRRHYHLDHDRGRHGEAGRADQQPDAGNDLHLPGSGIRKAGFLRLERSGQPDVHLGR